MKKDVSHDTLRKLFSLIVLLFLLISLIIGMLSMQSSNIKDKNSTRKRTEYHAVETLLIEKKDKETHKYEPIPVITEKEVIDIDYDEAQLLMKLARSEAGDNGEEAQLLVMNVVMNRVNDENFPDSIKEVIYAKNQFSVVNSGVMTKIEPNHDSHLALARLESGDDISDGALFFESSVNNKGSWHKTREFLFEKYGQRFYR